MFKGYDWELWGNYGYGWDLLTTTTTRAEIGAMLKSYRANDVHALGFKIKSVRVANA